MRCRYVTTYVLNNNTYSSHIYARSREDAQNIANMRNIGEIVEGVDYTPDLNKQDCSNPEKLMHEVCFMSFICLKSGVLTIEDVLGDEGIVHEFAHWFENRNPSLDDIYERVERLRKITPGYLR